MTKRIGFSCTGPISEVNRQSYVNQDEWVSVTDQAELEEVFKNCMCPENFSEYSDEYPYIYDFGSEFLFVDGVPSIKVTYYFKDDDFTVNFEDDTITHEDGTIRALEYLIDTVVDETRGQLSDGIGEGFEQEPCYQTDTHMYFISPGYPDMTVSMIDGE